MDKNVKCVNVSADIGNLTSIGISSKGSCICESRVKKFESGLDDFSQNQKFTFEGEDYLIGEGVYENEILKYSKDNYLPLLYYCIAKSTKDTDNNINLVTCTPVNQYKKKNELEEFIKKNNKKTIIIDGKERNIIIKNVKVLPESYSIKAIPDIMNNLNKTVDTTIIDVGGNTTDITIYDNKMQLKDGFSIRLGLLNLYNSCREYLNIQYDLSLSLEQAKRIFDNEESLLVGDFTYKEELVKKFIVGLINEIKGQTNNIKNTNILIIGGGSKIISSTMKKLYPQTTSSDNINLQAEGLLNIANKIYK